MAFPICPACDLVFCVCPLPHEDFPRYTFPTGPTTWDVGPVDILGDFKRACELIEREQRLDGYERRMIEIVGPERYKQLVKIAREYSAEENKKENDQ